MQTKGCVKCYTCMSIINPILGGFAGAIALNILHETVRKNISDPPRLDLLGEEVIEKTLDAVGVNHPHGKKLYSSAILGNIISNGLYYSTIGMGKNKNTWIKALSLGLVAGTAALKTPKHIGLEDSPVNRTGKTKIITLCLYLTGALVSAAVIQALNKRS